MTVIYTSHYMEEVEYLCRRIGIIDHGRMIALGDKDGLKRSVINQEKIEVEVSSVTPTLVEKLKALKSLAGVTAQDNRLTIYSNDGPELVANVLSVIAKTGMKVYSVKVEEPNLESVFLSLTGRALRD
jgi:ABC-2 type transport system ATP-binding protein